MSRAESTSRAEARTRSRAAILDRVRRATAGFAPPTVDRTYRGAGEGPDPGPARLIEIFVDRLVDYKAGVQVTPESEVASRVAAIFEREAAARIIVPTGFPETWLPSRPGRSQWLSDDPSLSTSAIDGSDGVVTTAALAIAETGTIVLDSGPGQGRRALTLLPDLHLVVVTADRLVARVPDSLDRLDPCRPLTWISGPSATSDIELDRVEGVHGPRRLHVLVVTD